MRKSSEWPRHPGLEVGCWLLMVGLPCVATVAGLLWTLVALEPHYRPVGKDHQRRVERKLLLRVKQWTSNPDQLAASAVFMADSLGICFDAPGDPQDRIADQVRHRLKTPAPSLGLLDLTHPGLRPLQFYSLVNAFGETRSALVVLEINLRLFRSRNREADGGVARLPHLARTLGWRQAWVVRRDLADEGLTVLDPFLMRIKQKVGLLYTFEDVRDALAGWLIPEPGPRRNVVAGRHGELRDDAAGPSREASYEIESANEPKALTMRAVLSELHRNHVPALIYVAPINVERLRRNGISAARIAERIERLRSVIGASPTEWLDLHEAVPEALFRDQLNHLRYDGCAIVGAEIARRIRGVIDVAGQARPGAL